MLNIVLLVPEIPQNTGNIARTCAATRAKLHLKEPMGFSVDEKQVKRAGLDYWHMVDLTVYKNLDDLYAQNPEARPYMATTKAKNRYTDVAFKDGDYIIFGRETLGLPEDMLHADPERCMRIPRRTDARSLNLANSVAVVCYEALRQLDFPEIV